MTIAVLAGGAAAAGYVATHGSQIAATFGMMPRWLGVSLALLLFGGIAGLFFMVWRDRGLH